MSFNPQEHMLKLKGRDYLQVLWRLVWFREEKPQWSIDTQMVGYDAEAKHAIFRAVISDESGTPKSTGYGSESARDFGDFIEKAETKAVGRALAMLGYGTQFAPEMDEGERIVDSPVAVKKEPLVCADCGGEICSVRDKRDGREIPAEQVARSAEERFGARLCGPCQKKRVALEKAQKS